MGPRVTVLLGVLNSQELLSTEWVLEYATACQVQISPEWNKTSASEASLAIALCEDCVKNDFKAGQELGFRDVVDASSPEMLTPLSYHPETKSQR